MVLVQTHKLVIGMKNHKGFTLIEILIVLMIIGITLSFAILSFGDFGEGRKVKVLLNTSPIILN